MAVKASEHYKVYTNPNGKKVSTVTRRVIEQDGLYFKDIDGSGEVSKVNDWRLPAKQRAEAYAQMLSVEEKIGQLFISDWRMGKYPTPLAMGSREIPEYTLDETGILDEAEHTVKNIFGEQYIPGTSKLLKEWWARHIILRANATPDDLADYLNQLQAVAEECDHFVPVMAASNSRNEYAEPVFGMNDASGVFAAWPGTMGIAAAVKGTGDLGIVDDFSDCIRRTWNASNLRKGYMYMVDVMTDPRWQRTYGTFGEDTELICKIAEHMIPRIQGSEEGVTSEGVALTMKHFPGGGARENGYDPHYKAGQWNVYQTPGSLEKYHLPGFQVSADKNAAAIMPYYAKPAKEKSAVQVVNGHEMEMLPFGFAYNKPWIDGLLRQEMGFKGYINSDTGIVHNMCWGVEMLDGAERIGFAVNHAGVDVISGNFDHELGMEAYLRGKNNYYETHQVPEGFTKEQLVLTDEALNRAVARTLQGMFELGMFEDTYRDPKLAVKEASKQDDWDKAMDVHRKSVTLLKNDDTLPLTAEKLADKKVYVEAFHQTEERATMLTKELKGMLADVTLVDNPEEADYAILMLNPKSGAYFSATKGYLELDICEGKMVPDVDELCRPMEQMHEETTLAGAKRIPEIASVVHANGGKVIANVNVVLAWQLGNVEPYVDALTLGYDTYPLATLDVYFGRFSPVGKLPITMPKGDEVLKVDAQGVCISPNDVPGYDKDKYMPDWLKDENGKAYAYRDGAGNYYELNFGLTY
ncbi:MAG: glycoside hydrolase family 3 protein [Lachnospiraceae bacterium]|nr:glycoside hydrolase family 3 protein [Lachnospiraceae bacterium]